MQEIHLDNIQAFNDYNGMETLHPLVSVIHVDNTEHIKECTMHYGFYAIYLKENKGCKLSYGRTEYDFRFFKAMTGKTPTQWRAA